MIFISLKTKFIALCVLLSTGTAGLLGSYMVWESYESLRAQAQQAQLALAKTLAWQVDQGVSRAFQAIIDLSKRPETRDMNKRLIIPELNFVTSTTELLDGLLIVSNDWGVVAKTHPAVPAENLPPKAWFKANRLRIASLTGSVLVDFYKTPKGNVGVVIAAPIRNPKDRNVWGTLAGILYIPNHTIGNLEDVHVGKTGYVYLVNEDGIAIIHPDRWLRLVNMSDNPSVQALRTHGEGILQYRNQKGEEILSAFAKIASSGWGIVVHLPASECYAPANRMLKVMSAFLLLTLALSAALSALLARHIVHPILALAGRVEKIDTGKFNIGGDRPSSSANDEVGLLDQAISRMTRRLEFQDRERERSHQRALLAEKKLHESEKLASIGQLAASLAHELNNPLSVILGTAQLISRYRERHLKRWANRVIVESDRCRKLVSDLLDFAKPLQLRPRSVDLVKLAERCWSQVDRTSARVPCQLRVSHRVFMAKVDPDRFQQVFLNLMTNSVQAMPQGGTVMFRFHRSKDAVSLLVKDEGPGLRLRNAERIFQPFFTTKTKGTGLGLAIARAILRAHGGTIGLRSNPKKGALFVLSWPDQSSKEKDNGT